MQFQSPQPLSIYQSKDKILQTLSTQNSLIISGHTGCGKSTQLPQILHKNNPNSKILVLVPRKIAAYALANRVKEEIDEEYKNKVTVWNSENQYQFFQKFNIVFISYVVFNNIVMIKGQLQADFILFDQVHERTNQMDKAMVMVKRLVNQQIIHNHQGNQHKKYNNNSNIQNIQIIQNYPKIIIMSATINVNLFSEYWSTHIHTEEMNYIKIINDQIAQQHKNYKKDEQNKQQQDQLYSTLHDKKSFYHLNKFQQQNQRLKDKRNISKHQQNKNYINAPIINIEGSTNYQITDLFIDKVLQYWPDENNKRPIRMGNNYQNRFVEYRLNDKQIQISRYYYEKAIQIIKYYEYNSSLQSHDTLVFLPGLAEIQQMKQRLIRQLLLSPSLQPQQQSQQERLIIIHSQFLQGLQQKLFTPLIKNKIFLSTDMAQSSITLPNCTLVIDFCLQRKISTQNGIMKLQTQLASKSNLVQRRGRVGRSMDGICVRMITEKMYQKLDQYEMPEIQKCSLGRTILQLKNGHLIFCNPYEFLLNVVQPPSVGKINDGVKDLLKFDALKYNEASKANNQIIPKQKFSQKNAQKIQYKGKQLQITQTGRFFIRLQCQPFLSNMILNSYKYEISQKGVLIVSILSLEGRIFLKIDKRQNLQNCIDAMIKYDSKYLQENKKIVIMIFL